MKELTILRGIPGSGKSSTIGKLVEDSAGYAEILSTDDYFVDHFGNYRYNKDLIGQAHEWNFTRFRRAVAMDFSHIIIDNTNIEFKDILKYAEPGIKKGYSIRLVEPDTTWRYNVEECFKRNTHKVPRETIQNMLNRFEPTDRVLNKLYNYLNPNISISHSENIIYVSPKLST